MRLMSGTGFALLTLLRTGLVGATTPPVCNGTVTFCRPCATTDEGQPDGCTGATPVCETNEENPRYGSCVQCTSDSACASTTPICITSGPSADSCRACAADAECVVNPAGTSCLTSGACGAVQAPTEPPLQPSSCSTIANQPMCLAGVLLLAVLLCRRPSRRLVTGRSFVELASARRQALPSRSPASEARRSANRCP
jgi:hypothetical protein